MKIDIPLEFLEALVTDPVMSGELFTTLRLDHFQRFRLRQMWYIPTTIDSSGVSTGKTAVNWLYVTLRAMILGRRVAVVFQNMETGKKEFWPYFYNFGMPNPYFAAECIGEANTQSSMSMKFHSGGEVYMRAPDHGKDGKGWASMRFHDMLLEEWLEIESLGNSIDKQLITRPTMATFNDEHPIHTNHVKFSGHAGSPSSKGYKRYKRFHKTISKGSQRHGLFSFCYKDFSEKFAKFAKEKQLTEVKINSGIDAFIRQVLGIWKRDGASFYGDSTCSLALKNVQIQTRRPLIVPPDLVQAGVDQGDIYYFSGRDTASSDASTSDFSSDVVLRAAEVDVNHDPSLILDDIGYRLRYVYAQRYVAIKNKYFSGVYYFLHNRFHFSKTVMDPGGGGTDVYRHMQERNQTFGQGFFEVEPVCHNNDPDIFEKNPIITMFKRSPDFDVLFPVRFSGDEGLLDGCHRKWRTAWSEQYFEWPKPEEDLDPAIWNAYTGFERKIHNLLTEAYREVIEIKNMTRPDGTAMLNKRNFLLFHSRIKKDMAYTALYAYVAFLLWHKERLQSSDRSNDEIAV